MIRTWRRPSADLLSLDCDVVESIADGSALEAAQRLQPEVVVLDAATFRTSTDWRRAVRLAGASRDEVIVFTADGRFRNQGTVLELGAAAFVSKLAHGDPSSAIRRLCRYPGDQPARRSRSPEAASYLRVTASRERDRRRGHQRDDSRRTLAYLQTSCSSKSNATERAMNNTAIL